METTTKQKMELDMFYYYRGASCCWICIEEESGWIKVFNDYNEIMFTGATCEMVKFMNDLMIGKFA